MFDFRIRDQGKKKSSSFMEVLLGWVPYLIALSINSSNNNINYW